MKRFLLALGCTIAWNFPGAIAAPASQTNSSASNAPKGPGMQKLYRKAMEAYEAKRYDEAVDAFQQILKQQPEHSPSKIYLARCLYQQKNLSEAYKVFQTVELKALEPDAAYDYGQVSYRQNDPGTALKAFAMIPNGHPLYDLAGFYGGISAYNLGDYQQAIDLFDQAVVLPSKLVNAKKMYRKEAEKKILKKEKLEVQNKANPGRSPALPLAPLQAPPTEFVVVPSHSVSLVHSYTNQTVEAKKGKPRSTDLNRTRFKAEWGSDTPSASAKSQLLYLGSITAMATKDGNLEEFIIPSPDEQLKSQALKSFDPDSLIRPELAVVYEKAIGENSTIGVRGGVYGYAGDGHFSNEFLYTPYLTLFVAQKGDTIETSFKADFLSRIYNKQSPIVFQSYQEGQVKVNFSKKVYFSLSGQLNEYAYNENPIAKRLSGPDWDARVIGELGFRQEKALTLALGGFYAISPGYRQFDTYEEYNLVGFDLSQTGGYARVDMSFTPWFNLGIFGKIAMGTYEKAQPEGVEIEAFLDSKYGSKISQFGLYASFQKNF